MYRTGFIFIFILLVSGARAQENGKGGIFKPGTLAGKYYGTYDTSAKKIDLKDSTKLASGLQLNPSDNGKRLNTGLSQKPQLQVNQNFNPIEVSGTTRVSAIDVNPTANQGKEPITSLSERPKLQINQNYDPIEISGTTQAAQIDIASPEADKTFDNRQLATQAPAQVPHRTIAPETPPLRPVPSTPYRDTRLGSSSPLYNTYRTNDNGAGSVTTNPNKEGGGMPASASQEVVNQSTHQPQKTFYGNIRLGSSSPLYNTYRTNENGAGSVTTNPNKGGGGAPFAAKPAQHILPEQAPADTTAAGKTAARIMEK